MTPKFRVLIATTLVCIAALFFSGSMLWAKEAQTSLSSDQKKALNKCISTYVDDYARCLREHPHLAPKDCQDAANAGYRACKKAAGIPLEQFPPPKTPTSQPSATPAGIKPSNSPTPRPKPLETPGQAAGKVKDKSTPTPTPKPKPKRKLDAAVPKS